MAPGNKNGQRTRIQVMAPGNKNVQTTRIQVIAPGTLDSDFQPCSSGTLVLQELDQGVTPLKYRATSFRRQFTKT